MRTLVTFFFLLGITTSCQSTKLSVDSSSLSQNPSITITEPIIHTSSLLSAVKKLEKMQALELPFPTEIPRSYTELARLKRQEKRAPLALLNMEDGAYYLIEWSYRFPIDVVDAFILNDANLKEKRSFYYLYQIEGENPHNWTQQFELSGQLYTKGANTYIDIWLEEFKKAIGKKAVITPIIEKHTDEEVLLDLQIYYHNAKKETHSLVLQKRGQILVIAHYQNREKILEPETITSWKKNIRQLKFWDTLVFNLEKQEKDACEAYFKNKPLQKLSD